MGVRVIPEKSFSEGRDATIVVASDLTDLAAAIEDVKSMEARQKAIDYAATKLEPPLSNPAVSSLTPEDYPVDRQGREILEPGTAEPVGYEARIRVASTK